MVRITRPLGGTPINFVASRTSAAGSAPNITEAGLADWLGMSATEASADQTILAAILESSVDRCVKASGYIPAAETWEFRYDGGRSDFAGISPDYQGQSTYIDLPRQPIRGVTSVTIDGETVTPDDLDLVSNPPRVLLPASLAVTRDFASIIVEAEAGPAAGEDADPRFVQAVYALAGWTYENRGCDLSGGFKKSGASSLLSQVKVATGGL